MRQRHWIELHKNSDCTIEYYPGKANVVVDALSRKVMKELRAMFARLSLIEDGGLLAELQVRPTLLEEIKLKQSSDMSLVPQMKLIEEGKASDFAFNFEGVLCYRERYCVPSNLELRQSILMEAHSNLYAMHLGGSKMYRDLHE